MDAANVEVAQLYNQCQAVSSNMVPTSVLLPERYMTCPHDGEPNESSRESCSEYKKSNQRTDDAAFAQPQAEHDAITSWCWGGFLLTWIWALGNGVWAGLLAFIPLLLSGLMLLTDLGPGAMPLHLFVACIELGFAGWLGLYGRKLAWRTGRWNSLEHFVDVQKRWAVAGVWFWIVLGILSMPYLFISALLFSFFSGKIG